MNLYAVIVLSTLIVTFIIDRISTYLNLRAMSEQVPAEFNELYDADKYAASQRYSRAKARFGAVHDTFDLGVLLAFWGAGGFQWLDQVVRAIIPSESPIVLGVVYLPVLFLAKGLVGLPFSLYATFVLEARFGFNKTTPATFLADLLKGLLLGCVLGIPLVAAVLWFFVWAGQWAWLLAWALVAVFTIAIQYVVPSWIMPLFNKFSPLPDGELRTRLLAFAERVQFPLNDVSVIDGSKRSSKANAFFTGFGKRKRIALYDTLVNTQTVDEVLAVLAHEVGHYKKGHVLRGLIFGLLHLGAMLFALGFVLRQPGLYQAFGVSGQPLYIGLVLFGLLMAPIELALSLVLNLQSRRHEFEADAFAADTCGNGEALVSGLKKLSVNHLANLTPHPLTVALSYSHPPVLERIHAIRRRVQPA